MDCLQPKELATKLRAAGYKVTPQRMAVYAALAAVDVHPTAEMLFADIHSQYPNMSFATVYKTLNVLSDVGVVRRLDMGEASSRFDATMVPHSHVQCIKCGKVFDVCDLSQNILEEQVKEETGVAVTKHDFYFYGLCAECQQIK